MILITCLCRRTFFVGDKKCADDICLHAGDILGGQNGDFMLPKLNNRFHRILIGCRELLADGKAA